MGTVVMHGQITKDYMFAFMGDITKPFATYRLYIGHNGCLRRIQVTWKTTFEGNIVTSLQAGRLHGKLMLSWYAKTGTWDDTKRFEINRHTLTCPQQTFGVLASLAGGRLPLLSA